MPLPYQAIPRAGRIESAADAPKELPRDATARAFGPLLDPPAVPAAEQGKRTTAPPEKPKALPDEASADPLARQREDRPLPVREADDAS